MNFGNVKEAEILFEQMKKKSVVSYGAIMHGHSSALVQSFNIVSSTYLGYLKNNLNEKALELLEKISLKSNGVLYAIAYKACASLINEKTISMGKKIFQQMPKSISL